MIDAAFLAGIVAFFVLMVQGVNTYARRSDNGGGDRVDLPDMAASSAPHGAVPADASSR